MKPTLLLLILATFFAQSCAWGRSGHIFTGSIAQAFLSQPAKIWVSRVLPTRFHGMLSEATSWADTIKRQFPWSYTMHFIDAQYKTPDEGGDYCELDMERDCEEGVCVVTAVSNYTERLIGDADANSLLFLIHFIGDLHQPLHNVAKFRGGNDYAVRFGRDISAGGDVGVEDSMNMHGLWDYALMDKWIRQYYRSSSYFFLDSILKKLQTGIWAAEKDTWLTCPPAPSDIYRPIPTICPAHWSQETGRLNCKSVWVGVDHTTDLGGDYYDRNAPILEKQLAIAGYRMAMAINEIVEAKIVKGDFGPGGSELLFQDEF